MMSESLRIPSKDEIIFSLFLPPKPVSAVRQYGDESCFDASASFLSLPDSGRLKSADRKSENKLLGNGFSIIWFAEWCRNPCGFLHKIWRFRFFYRRKPSLPYASTATSRASTLLHLFYLSPIGYRSIPPQSFKTEWALSIRCCNCLLLPKKSALTCDCMTTRRASVVLHFISRRAIQIVPT